MLYIVVMVVEVKVLVAVKGSIHKGYLHLGGGKGLATMWTKVDKGREGI